MLLRKQESVVSSKMSNDASNEISKDESQLPQLQKIIFDLKSKIRKYEAEAMEYRKNIKNYENDIMSLKRSHERVLSSSRSGEEGYKRMCEVSR